MSKITLHIYWNIKRENKKFGKIEILTYIYIYINAQLSYFKVPQVNMYMFNWKRARAQLKHAHVQLKACICITEVCICWYVGVKRAYAQLVACTCSQLREKSWTQKNCFCTRNARFFHLNIPQGTQATCWFQKWNCQIFQWNIPKTLFWNDIYYMRENVKVKMFDLAPQMDKLFTRSVNRVDRQVADLKPKVLKIFD